MPEGSGYLTLESLTDENFELTFCFLRLAMAEAVSASLTKSFLHRRTGRLDFAIETLRVTASLD